MTDPLLEQTLADLAAARQDFEHFTSTPIRVNNKTFRVSAACAVEVQSRLILLENALVGVLTLCDSLMEGGHHPAITHARVVLKAEKL